MTKKKSLLPFRVKSLDNLPGERWKAIPGFEEEYEISSFGRVKSLRRWRAAGRGGGYYTTEKIKQQNVRRRRNKFLGIDTHTIGVSLKRDGKAISRSTSRYVYSVFVDPFDLDDKEMLVSYKDFNGLNLHYKNLFLTNRSDNSKKSFQLNRSFPKLCENRIPVRQTTLSGKIIASYSSLKEAQDKT